MAAPIPPLPSLSAFPSPISLSPGQIGGPVGVLGMLVFLGGLGSTTTFNEIGKKRKNSFAKHRILNGVDLIEDTGFDPIELDMKMRFFAPYTADPSISLAELEAMEDSKIPVPLIIGGLPMGRQILTLWVIEEISSKMSKFLGSKLMILDCDVKLLEYSNPISLAGPLGALSSVGAAVVGSLI